MSNRRSTKTTRAAWTHGYDLATLQGAIFNIACLSADDPHSCRYWADLIEEAISVTDSVCASNRPIGEQRKIIEVRILGALLIDDWIDDGSGKTLRKELRLINAELRPAAACEQAA